MRVWLCIRFRPQAAIHPPIVAEAGAGDAGQPGSPWQVRACAKLPGGHCGAGFSGRYGAPVAATGRCSSRCCVDPGIPVLLDIDPPSKPRPAWALPVYRSIARNEHNVLESRPSPLQGRLSGICQPHVRWSPSIAACKLVRQAIYQSIVSTPLRATLSCSTST